ncbi:hypothetical protein [Flagellimonas allohymeniacidonis]|uniref:hypothetical protein n=1 Tax=Flagellimonas allohymeniacidonis TaxID=2517819 RepID=UPI0013EE5ACF|nr:hypothetical protein [Allomuricauda hymeniacidonis]
MKTATKYRTPLFFGFSTCGVPSSIKEKSIVNLKSYSSREWSNTKTTIYNQ